jgi:type I restriction enzyme, S subunit
MNKWQSLPLGDVVTLQRGFDLPHRARSHGNIPIVSSAGVTDYHNTSMVDPPGVVTGRYGTIGELFFVEEPFWPLNTTLYVRDFHGNDPLFIYYHLQRFDFTTFSGKSGVPGVNRNDLHAETVALPVDIEEQRSIATALSDVDGLLDGLDQLIAKKRDLKQAAMQQLLTGQTRLPGFNGEWVAMSLFDMALRKKELFDDGDWIESEHITADGIRLIQTGNIGVGSFIEKEEKKYINEVSFTSLQCKQLKHDDLLICRLADPAGRACLLGDIGEERIVTSVDVTIFRPPAEMADRLFLAQLFSTSNWFRRVSDRCGGTTHKRISRGALGRLLINLPPLLEQTAISEVLSDMDAELAALEQRRNKTRALKQAMMQELLTGRTRLV